MLIFGISKNNDQRIRQRFLQCCATFVVLAVGDAWLGGKARHGPQQAQKNATAHD